MTKTIAVMGSTGSIGRQTLDVAKANPDKIKIGALAAHANDEFLEQQIRIFKPDIAAIFDYEAAKRLKARYNGETEILAGEEGLLAVATYNEIDTLVAAISGYAGLRSTLAAVENKKNIALANKETLVAAGGLFMEAVKRNNVSLLPVDSEHSAVFQSLNGEKNEDVKRLLITASGGPFRGKQISDLETVSLEQCLSHPKWSMGKKITVDSATLANKGLEVIEAHWLFGIDYDKIEVVVHPQSIVHSLVEFNDGSVIAQMGLTDMKLPIQYALSFPKRWDNAFGQLDLIKASPLTFEEPDVATFPLLKIAVECGKAGGTAPCAFNAANEEAVYAFLAGKIRFLDIASVVSGTLDIHENINNPTLEDIESVDEMSRNCARLVIKKLN
ncbi:MAG: 1-deoxy-D-xylulose-5-phosphate reductoisomerase [Acidaminococcaceae bacterium]